MFLEYSPSTIYVLQNLTYLMVMKLSKQQVFAISLTYLSLQSKNFTREKVNEIVQDASVSFYS